MIALSASVIGIAATAALSTLRGLGAPAAHRRLLAVYALLAARAAVPLVSAFAGTLYTLYMPAPLPMLLALPPAVYVYVEELTAPGLDPPASRYHAFLPLAGCAVTIGYWILPAAPRATMSASHRAA